MTLLIMLVALALCAYILGVAIFLTNQWTTPAEKFQKCKVIPAEVVLITIPINIGLSMNPASGYRLITDDKMRGYTLMFLVFVTILVYVVQLNLGKGLHARNQENAFCANQTDKSILTVLYGISFAFIGVALAMAKL